MSLIVCAAGAGSGKTHSICERIANDVAAGLDPARVIAMTFTKKAAAELKARIQSRILREPRLTLAERVTRAERLELAAIGTIDSVAHKLLHRYALRLGMSSRLDVLDEDAERRTIARLLQAMDPEPWDRLAEVTARFGASDAHDTALQLLQLKRGNRIADDAFVAQMRANADRTCHVFCPDGPDPDSPEPGELYEVMARVRDALTPLNCTTNDTKDTLGRIHQMLRSKSGGWNDFAVSANLKAGKRSGALDALAPLHAFGLRVRRMPGLHADARALLELLAQQTLTLDAAYQAYKRERGLLDFTDLETHLLDLLEREDVADDIRASYSLVVIDEFQDTNPIQLAIFLRLGKLVEHNYWVGDEKQAIYGFRGSDAELMQAVWKSVPENARERIGTSHRSQAGLVAIANRLFVPVFGDDSALAAKLPALPFAVERWLIDAKNEAGDREAITRGILALHEEGTALADIAVLARTNMEVENLAGALQDAGLSVTVELPGLLAKRECVVALAGLALVGDGHDALAAATLQHHLSVAGDEAPTWLAERLRVVRSGERGAPWPDDPLLNALRVIDARALSPTDALGRVITTLDLPTRIARWGDPARRAIHLDALLGLARKYEDDARRQRASATVTGLIAWLGQLESDGKDTVPTPAGLDAITLQTYHGAKGLEWPVVVMASLKTPKDPDPWEPRVAGGNIDADAPLEGRTIRYWPWPYGRGGGPFQTKTGATGLKDDALATPEGETLLAHEHAESLRLLYVGFTRAKRRVILAHRDHADAEKRKKHYEWLGRVPGVDATLADAFTEGTYPIALAGNAHTSLRVRQLAPADVPPLAPLARVPWIGDARMMAVHPPRTRNPSRMTEDASGMPLRVEAMAGATRLAPPHTAHVDAFGNAMHAYFASLPSTASLDARARAAIARRCIAAHRMEDAIDVEHLVMAGERLREWIATHHAGATWRTEVPVTAPADDGAQWVGTLDVALLGSDGTVAIVDHKTGGAGRDGPAAAAQAFIAQLRAYVSIVTEAGLPVRDAKIHMPTAGVMVDVGEDRRGA